MNFYAIYDRVSKLYARPFNMDSNTMAVRSVTLELRKPDSILSIAQQDLELHLIGNFTEETAITACRPPRIVKKISEIQKGMPNANANTTRSK